MLGRKNYTKEELDHAKAAVAQQLAAYKGLAAAGATKDAKVSSAVTALEPVLFNNMVLVLDRYFVHRIRVVTGKDTNALNEVELLGESLMSNGGVLKGNNVIKWMPDKSVLKLEVGDTIRLTQADFERLADAFFGELEAKFL
jgi:hypothetical protein